MPRRVCTISCLAFGLVLALALGSRGQPASVGSLADAAPWKFDRITLKNGQVVQGVIESENEAGLRLLEFRRPEGRGMYAVSLPLERAAIAGIDRLAPPLRDETRARFERFRNRTRVEAGKMDELTLEGVVESGQRHWRYRGPWFSLESTAAEDVTRRSIVRIEQVFTAFAQMLPPRVQAQTPLRIMLFGTTAQYGAFLQAGRLPVDNPAVFVAESNLVAAGSELNKFSEQLIQVRAQHNGLRAEIEQVRRELPEKLKQKRQQLDAAGGRESTRRRAMLSFKRQCDDELAALERTLNSFDRKNDALFQDVTERMFARLYHEAFHAYLENYVYPHRQFNVPRWLNEGLAQVFEAGLLENETLRVDAANKPALDALRAVLRSPQALPLARVLSADERSFLVAHGGSGASGLYYAYSWGIAHYLTFERPVLGGAALDEYAASKSGQADDVARFEQLVGTTLEEFEPLWRKYILDLKASDADERKPAP